MNLYTGFERRRSQRVLFPYELFYKDPNKGTQGFKHAYGKNISEHGVLFESYESFPALTILEIRLEIPVNETENKSFVLLAEVVRIEEKKKPWLYNIAVSFCKVDSDFRSLINEYTQNNLGKTLKDFSNQMSAAAV